MCRIIHFTRPLKQCRLTMRRSVVGAEQRLLKAFIRRFLISLPDRDYALFVEPRMPTGFPDCVLVEYDPCGFSSWTKSRHALSDTEMKVLFALPKSRLITVATVARKACMAPRLVLPILESLVANGDAVCEGHGRYRAVYGGIRGVKRIVSIEAKVSCFNRVLDQATLNRLFANDSYVLMPERTLSSSNHQALSDSRVGMYTVTDNGMVKRIKRSSSTAVSKSYLSLYFNEWIGWRLLAERKMYGKQSISPRE